MREHESKRTVTERRETEMGEVWELKDLLNYGYGEGRWREVFAN